MYYIIVQCNHKRPGFHVIGTYPLSDIEEENARLEAELAHLRLSAPPTMPRLPPTTPVALGNVNTLPGLHQELRELQEQVDALRKETRSEIAKILSNRYLPSIHITLPSSCQ